MNINLGDTADGLADDAKFLEDVDNNCAIKQTFVDENVKYRTQEPAALADTINMLNDDGAFELLKKPLLGTSASFMQMTVDKNCVIKQKLFDDHVKYRSQELAAPADTIHMSSTTMMLLSCPRRLRLVPGPASCK